MKFIDRLIARSSVVKELTDRLVRLEGELRRVEAATRVPLYECFVTPFERTAPVSEVVADLAAHVGYKLVYTSPQLAGFNLEKVKTYAFSDPPEAPK